MSENNIVTVPVGSSPMRILVRRASGARDPACDPLP